METITIPVNCTESVDCIYSLVIEALKKSNGKAVKFEFRGNDVTVEHELSKEAFYKLLLDSTV